MWKTNKITDAPIGGPFAMDPCFALPAGRQGDPAGYFAVGADEGQATKKPGFAPRLFGVRSVSAERPAYLTRSTSSNPSSSGVARPKIEIETFTRFLS